MATEDALVAATGTNAAPDTVIQPPLLSPPRSSLMSAADVLNGDGDWTRGYTYSPDGCGEGGLGVICPSPGAVKASCSNATLVSFQPFYVYSSDKCSAFSFKERDYYARAQRRLAAAESYLIEREFMLDSLGLGNSPVASPSTTTLTTGAVSPTTALAVIEDGIASCSRGNRMMIHVRPGILTLLAADSAVRREGNVWLTASDNIVVPGRGYPGTGPNGEAVTAGSEWIYATSMVQIRRGSLVMTPTQAAKTEENPMGIPPEAVDRSHNDIFVLAERIVSVAHDPTCCVLVAQTARSN